MNKLTQYILILFSETVPTILRWFRFFGAGTMAYQWQRQPKHQMFCIRKRAKRTREDGRAGRNFSIFWRRQIDRSSECAHRGKRTREKNAKGTKRKNHSRENNAQIFDLDFILWHFSRSTLLAYPPLGYWIINCKMVWQHFCHLSLASSLFLTYVVLALHAQLHQFRRIQQKMLQISRHSSTRPSLSVMPSVAYQLLFVSVALWQSWRRSRVGRERGLSSTGFSYFFSTSHFAFPLVDIWFGVSS